MSNIDLAESAAIRLLYDELCELTQKVELALERRPRCLTTEEAARYINRTVGFLKSSRSDGRCKGPDFIELEGRIIYAIEDLDRWVDELKRKKGTVAVDMKKAS